MFSCPDIFADVDTIKPLYALNKLIIGKDYHSKCNFTRFIL